MALPAACCDDAEGSFPAVSSAWWATAAAAAVVVLVAEQAVARPAGMAVGEEAASAETGEDPG